jgi:hypothetical protein
MSLRGQIFKKPTRDQISIIRKRYPFHGLNLDGCLSKIHIPYMGLVVIM